MIFIDHFKWLSIFNGCYAIGEKFRLKRLKILPFYRDFKKIDIVDGLFVIRGPRQIGKTSWLKTILSSEVKRIGYQKCFYLSCENVENRKELTEILKSLRSCDLILLDEISYIKDWALSIKHEIDLGKTKTLILTGSNATDLRKGGEQLPGRFGGGYEYNLLPMGISEFQKMRQQARWPNLDKVELLKLFFKVGGFPAALAESGKSAKTPFKARETYKKWLLGDFLKLGKRESYFRELIGQLALTLGTSISLQKIVQKTGLGSHHTALEYIETLEDCFALRKLFAINPDNSSYHFRKDKKFYFTDPLIFWIALELSGFDFSKNYEEALAEMVAHEEISRCYPNTRFGYLSSKKGEIDFFCPKKWAIEVKWSDYPQNLSKAYLNHLTSWKTVWCKSNFGED
ncbi:MAG: ATP-binding protein [Bacteriovoracaceae bacterium]|nr:ATP-binding protein [Bacteriovoracaceae bacterium]